MATKKAATTNSGFDLTSKVSATASVGMMDLVIVKTPTKKPESLEDLFEAGKKIVLLFDRSGSMSQQVPTGRLDSFDWTPEVMDRVRKEVATQFAYRASVPEEDRIWLGTFIHTLANMANPDTGLCDLPDEEIQNRVIENGLIGELNIPINWAKHGDKLPSRLDLVKRVAKRELTRRFEKYPGTQVTVLAFEDFSEMLSNEGPLDALWSNIDRLYTGGGTNIAKALNKAMDACRKKPSQSGMYHFILVTDGEDSFPDVEGWAKLFRESCIVLDYIHIGARYENDELKKLCAATGGEFQSVTTEKAYEDKFVEAMNRRALPAAMK